MFYARGVFKWRQAGFASPRARSKVAVMKLPRTSKILLSIILFAAAGAFGTSKQIYSGALAGGFFAIALFSVAIIHLRVCKFWPDGPALLGWTGLLALVDFRLLSFPHHIMAWFSFLGLGSLLLLALRSLWSNGDRQKLLLSAFVPAFLFVASEWFASDLLAVTARLHPKTLDLFLYSFDGTLHVQLSFLMGQAFAMWPLFKIIGFFFYIGLPIPIAMVYSGQLVRVREKAFPAMAAFLLTGPIGVVFYNLFPAAGPIALVPLDFPWHPLPTEMARRLFLEPVAIHGARNAIPSLHMAWVLLAWWFSRGLSRLERGIALLFVVWTFCATMGLGEHYFIDLVLACPFALFMAALCTWPPVWKRRTSRDSLFFGLLATLLWFAGLRFGTHFFWISPILPWALCVLTVGCTVWLRRRLEAADANYLPTKALDAPQNAGLQPQLGERFN